mmetsp:Transcript_12377/g.11963  ORF Transcript_12377/g.11963 Transcript_12377/m.11963 type:complete len:504 (-) Transcript_12377:314-1825(-)
MITNSNPTQTPIQFPPPKRDRMVPQVSDGDLNVDTTRILHPQGYTIMYDASSNSQHLLMQHQPEHFRSNIQNNLLNPQINSLCAGVRGPTISAISQFDDAEDESCFNKKLLSSGNKRKSLSYTQVKKSRSSSKKTALPKSQTSAKSALDALAFACAVEQNFQPCKVLSTSPTTSANLPRAKKDDVTSNRPSTNQNLVNEKVACDLQDSSSSTSISHNDVLCGRGGLTNHHPGNIFFRRMVRLRQESYLRASKRDEASVARDIVDTIRQLNPPGRFLKKGGDVWVEIGNRKAREKTSQALREGAPELREELQQSAQGNPVNSESHASSSSSNMTVFTEEQKQKLRMEEGQKVALPCPRAVVSLDDSMHAQIQAASFLSGDIVMQPLQQLRMSPHLITDERHQHSPAMQIPMQGNLPLNHLYYPDESQYRSDVIPGAKRVKTEFHHNPIPNNIAPANHYVPMNVHHAVVIRPSSDEESGPLHSPGRKIGGPRLKMFKNRMGSNRV